MITLSPSAWSKKQEKELVVLSIWTFLSIVIVDPDEWYFGSLSFEVFNNFMVSGEKNPSRDKNICKYVIND